MANYMKDRPFEKVDAIQLKRDLILRQGEELKIGYLTSGGELGLHAYTGYWLIDDGESQKVVSDEEFRRKYIPVTR